MSISTTKQIDNKKHSSDKSNFHKLDIPNLYLRVFPKNKTFTYRYRRGNSYGWLTLGKYKSELKLAEARDLTALIKMKISQNVSIDKIKSVLQFTKKPHEFVDVLNKFQESQLPTTTNKKMPTFKDMHEQWYEWKKPQWKNGKHVHQAMRDPRDLIYPYIGNKLINEITSEDIADALNPVLSRTYPTGEKLRGKIFYIFNFALDRRFIKINPTPPLNSSLFIQGKKQSDPQGFFKVDKVSELFSLLEPKATMHSLATIFILSTVKRVDEVCAMEWTEVDLGKKQWYIPPERTKNNRGHLCPLSDIAMGVLEVMSKQTSNKYVFPYKHKHLDINAPCKQIKRVIKGRESEFKALESKKVPTAHGIRHTFKTWCNQNRVPQDHSEYQLNHYKHTIAEVYNHYDFFEERKKLSDDWNRFLKCEN